VPLQQGTVLLIFNPVRRLTRERERLMTEEHPMMVGAATVFVVSNITKSIEHYRNAESMRHENLFNRFIALS
jgi:hypothetical protein